MEPKVKKTLARFPNSLDNLGEPDSGGWICNWRLLKYFSTISTRHHWWRAQWSRSNLIFFLRNLQNLRNLSIIISSNQMVAKVWLFGANKAKLCGGQQYKIQLKSQSWNLLAWSHEKTKKEKKMTKKVFKLELSKHPKSESPGSPNSAKKIKHNIFSTKFNTLLIQKS